MTLYAGLQAAATANATAEVKIAHALTPILLPIIFDSQIPALHGISH